jgi:TPR repeat protein
MSGFDEFRFNSGEERAWASEEVLETKDKAAGGDAEAQYQLGCFYVTGKSFLKPDMALALEWLGKAAAQGHEAAKEKLAEPERVKDVRGKAESGDAEAQYQLGCFYVTGKISLPMDMLKATEWFGKAAAQGHEAAKRMLK